MELFLYWLLRATILTVLFYGLYKWFFANNTFHSVNRFSLICILLLITVLPLFRFNLIPEKQPEPITESFWTDFSSIPVTGFVETQPRVEIPWIQILMILFVMGFLFTFARYLIGLAQIIIIIRKAEKQTLADHTVLCIADKNISPFSWMNYIVLSRKELSADNQAVIRHERAHIHFRHSVDMIFFDVFTSVFWFNPFSWLLRQEVQSVHEYQADQQVLNYGIDSKQYQLLLIRKSVGDYKFALANNFHQRDLHKRITMMKKNKTDRRVGWNYAMTLPVLFMAMIALSVPKLNAKAVEKENNETDLVEEKITVSGQVVDESGKPIPMVAIINKENSSGTISDNNGQFVLNTEKGATYSFVMVDYKERKVTLTKSQSDLKVILEKGEGESDELITVRIKGRDDVDEVVDNQSTVIVSGSVKDKQGVIIGGLVTIKGTKKGTVTDLDGNFRIKANIGDILQFSMINYKTVEYPVEKEENNLVVVLVPEETTSGDNKSGQDKLKVIGIDQMESSQNGKEKVTLRSVGGKQPLYIVDGKTISDTEMQKINADNIESISVLKDKAAIEIYGDKGKDGVILIETKKENKDNDIVVIGYGSMDSLRGNMNRIVISSHDKNSQDLDPFNGHSPLIVVDGEKMPEDFKLNTIDPNDIESISVLKDNSGTQMYGDEGKNGVIIITKKPIILL